MNPRQRPVATLEPLDHSPKVGGSSENNARLDKTRDTMQPMAIDRFRDRFNRECESVRLLAILSPT